MENVFGKTIPKELREAVLDVIEQLNDSRLLERRAVGLYIQCLEDKVDFLEIRLENIKKED